MKKTLRLVFAGLLISTAGLSHAAWPERTISLVVPFPPGGSTDIVGRLVGKELSERLGVSVVVENRPGAAGNVGSRYVSKAKPDGYTILMATTAQTIGAAIYKSPGYDILNDFSAVSTVNDGPLVLMSTPDSGIKNINDLIKASKEKPGGLTYGTPGYGSSAHMAAETLSLITGANLMHVPYQGAAPAMNDLIGGQIDVAFDLMLGARQFIEENRVQLVGAATRERTPLAPEWPTLAEQSNDLKNFHETAWNAIVVPKGTPDEIIEKLNSHFKEILASEEVHRRFSELGNIPIWKSAEDTQKFLDEDVTKWKQLVSEANIEQL